MAFGSGITPHRRSDTERTVAAHDSDVGEAVRYRQDDATAKSVDSESEIDYSVCC